MTNIKKITEVLEEKKADLMRTMYNISQDFANEHELNSNNYLCDLLNEFASASVDFYNSDLAEWLLHGNSYYVEKYVEEFGVDTRNFNFWNIVSGGQYLELQEQLQEDKENILEVLVLNYLLENANEIEKDLSEKDIENILEEVKGDCYYNDWLEGLVDTVNAYVFEEEENERGDN